MRALFRYTIDRLPYIRRLNKQIEDISASLKKQIQDAGEFPIGHYYSPLPTHQEVSEYLQSKIVQQRANESEIEIPDIHLDKESQFELLQEFKNYYNDVPFPEHYSQNFRYYFNQDFFCYADAIFLYCFLRHTKPNQIVEVGSGFSSAVILDSIENCFDHKAEITFIEPYTDRLNSILKLQDRGHVRIIEKKVQTVPLDIFTSLQAGDFLFIDSTHVLKCGSDVRFLMFEVLPRLSDGVFVHFHDIFYPFEYPAEWLLNGRYWNENYFVRAFLSYNSEWFIYFFNSYVSNVFNEFLAENMPLCLKNTGGSIYIQRAKMERK